MPWLIRGQASGVALTSSATRQGEASLPPGKDAKIVAGQAEHVGLDQDVTETQWSVVAIVPPSRARMRAFAVSVGHCDRSGLPRSNRGLSDPETYYYTERSVLTGELP